MVLGWAGEMRLGVQNHNKTPWSYHRDFDWHFQPQRSCFLFFDTFASPTSSYTLAHLHWDQSIEIFCECFLADPHCLLRCCCEARRNARSDPPPLLAGHGVSDSDVSFFLLSDFRQFLQVLGEFFPPPKSPHGHEHSARTTKIDRINCLLEVFSKCLKTSSQNPWFFSVSARFWCFLPPKMTPKSDQSR